VCQHRKAKKKLTSRIGGRCHCPSMGGGKKDVVKKNSRSLEERPVKPGEGSRSEILREGISLNLQNEQKMEKKRGRIRRTQGQKREAKEEISLLEPIEESGRKYEMKERLTSFEEDAARKIAFKAPEGKKETTHLSHTEKKKSLLRNSESRTGVLFIHEKGALRSARDYHNCEGTNHYLPEKEAIVERREKRTGKDRGVG